MQLMLRALLVLSLATPSHATKKAQMVSMVLGRGAEVKGRRVRLIMDPLFQYEMSRTSAPNIANMSLSPWMYRESCDEARLPRRLSHAQCLTSGCLSLQGEGEDAALVAKPIYYQALVLRRVSRKRHNNTRGGKKTRKYYFRLGTETIPVGCTCVRPTVVPQQ